MNARNVMALVAALGVWLVADALAQQTPEQGEAETVKVQAKQYKEIAPQYVYQAARENIQADVRFTDTYAERTVVPEGAQRVELGARLYFNVAAFRTGAELVCLLPLSAQEGLRTLLGISADRELTPQALNEPVALNRGQVISVEGTVLGTSAGTKYVVVDRMAPGELGPAEVRREVHLFWPTRAEPRIVTQTGASTFEFPCTHEDGAVDVVDISVETVTQSQLDARLAQRQSEREGRTEGRKTYGQYPAETVYRYAQEANPLNVDFSDTVARVVAAPLPRALQAADTFREGRPAQVPIATALRTESRTMVLIPQTWPTVIEQARAAVAGEPVRVRGTVIGPIGPYNCVLADSLTFPGRRSAQDGYWWVELDWAGMEVSPFFWDYGQYTLDYLPCQNVNGRRETLRVLISEFSQVRVPAGMPTPRQ